LEFSALSRGRPITRRLLRVRFQSSAVTRADGEVAPIPAVRVLTIAARLSVAPEANIIPTGLKQAPHQTFVQALRHSQDEERAYGR
jgi:hypothetical protein